MSETKKILYVEDDETLQFVTTENLERKGYNVIQASDGEAGWLAFNQHQPDLCLLDVMLPKTDGFTLARRIRKENEQVPIIFLTAKTMKEDRIEGLVLGGDDYILKPFSVEELLLRIQVFLRRSTVISDELVQQKTLLLGALKLDSHNLILSLPDGEQNLTPREADILSLFMRHPNELLSRETILEQIWGENDYFYGRSLDVFISKIRRMLKSNPDLQLQNKHGVGFRLKYSTNQ